MKRLRFTVRDLLLMLVIAALAAGWSADHQRLNRRLATQQWEYLHKQFNGLRDGMFQDAAEVDEFARLGSEGWEVFAEERSSDSLELWLKGPRNDRMRLCFTTHDLLWLTLLVAMAMGWFWPAHVERPTEPLTAPASYNIEHVQISRGPRSPAAGRRRLISSRSHNSFRKIRSSGGQSNPNRIRSRLICTTVTTMSLPIVTRSPILRDRTNMGSSLI